MASACLALATARGAAATPSAHDLAARCDTLTGEVRAGERWEGPFGDDLLFRLEPETNAPPNPPGWTIEVRSADGGDHDFAWVATPPYRWANPRYLNTAYGRTAQDAVAWDVRTFGFVTTEERYSELAEVVAFLLHRPAEMAEEAYESAYDSVRTRWSELLVEAGQGELRITHADVENDDSDPPGGRIERLAFRVTLCPADPPPRGRALEPR